MQRHVIQFGELIFDLTVNLVNYRNNHPHREEWDDSRATFHLIVSWAQEFKKEWKPMRKGVEVDYIISIDKFFDKKMKETECLG